LRKAGEKEMRSSLGDKEAAKARLRALGYKSEEISEYLGGEADFH